MPDTLSPAAQESLRLILLIRRNPSSQSLQAEKRVLSNLSVKDYISVIAAFETPGGAR